MKLKKILERLITQNFLLNDKKKHIAHLESKDKRNVSGDLFNPKNTPNGPNVNGDGMATQLRKKLIVIENF